MYSFNFYYKKNIGCVHLTFIKQNIGCIHLTFIKQNIGCMFGTDSICYQRPKAGYKT